jgi:hypothetical protein
MSNTNHYYYYYSNYFLALQIIHTIYQYMYMNISYIGANSSTLQGKIRKAYISTNVNSQKKHKPCTSEGRFVCMDVLLEKDVLYP